MRVEPATAGDLPAARAAYADARAIQREQGAILWPEFTDASILAEVAAGRLLRVTDDDGALVGVFSVADEDEAIWGERERGEHLYLHRIARAAAYPGRGLIGAVLAWARARRVALGRAGLRIDTWASNAALVAFYERQGFRVVGRRRIGAEPRLPAHYHGTELTLLESPWRPGSQSALRGKVHAVDCRQHPTGGQTACPPSPATSSTPSTTPRARGAWSRGGRRAGRRTTSPSAARASSRSASSA
jgi:GNAT superfamily N-acetyltransferase